MDTRQKLKHYYPALILFISFTCFSFYTYYQIRSSVQSRREKLFEQRTSRARETINKRLADYVQILKGCQALFYASDTVTAESWKTYIKNLNLSENYPGIQAVAFASWIKKDQVTGLENNMRESGYPEFKVRSTFRSDHLAPIIYIEPYSGRNLRALGFDMYSESERRLTMEKAMRSGKPALTKKLKLVQETNENVQPGFLLYLPVYLQPDNTKTAAQREKHLIGFVYNPFRAHDLMHSILQNYPHLHLQIYDGKPLKSNLLYDTHPAITSKKQKYEFLATQTIKVAGASWTIISSPSDTFDSNLVNHEAELALIIGLALTLLAVIISINTIKNKTRMVEELELSKEVEKKKDEFIGIAAHELKTPLTNVKAYIQLLERTNLGEKERSFVNKANSQVSRLASLIADLLDVSKIQRGTLQFNIQEFALKDLIYDSIETGQHLYKTHEIILEFNIPEMSLSGDKFRLEQALTNLLVNAIKYSPSAKCVYVKVRQQDGEIIIDVKDEGIGISEESQRRVFEKFYRAEGLPPVLSGLGMGLYISFEIVRRHNGVITVESKPGSGSTFSIHLPES